jgi:FAD/FMN-containing dehydrogenase
VVTTVAVATSDGGTTAIDESAIDRFRQAFKGELLGPGDAAYDEVRQIWNAMIQRRPALIARCSDASDVAEAVRFARSHGLLVAVRAGGHNIAGLALCDDGLVIDLSPMRAVRVDPDGRRADVEAGATLGELDAEAQRSGLATPLGINSTTGVAGLTLGGGFGWLSRAYGLTVDNLVAADIVTADGELVRASEDEHPDLFWALRGGGGNFGVVTRFEFRLHPVGPDVLSGLVVFPHAEAAGVLRRYRELIAQAPDELTVWAVLRKAPPLPFLPEEVHGTDVLALAICYAGKPADGEALVDSVRGLGSTYWEHVGAQPYAAWQQALDPLLTPGARNYWKTHNFRELSDSALDVIVEHAGRAPSPHCEVVVAALGGAVGRVPADATAYAHRDTPFLMNVHGRWEQPEEDEAGLAWARGLFAAIEPYAAGSAYVNFLTEDESERVATAYGSNYERLAQVKQRYDPQNLFRVNQNIRPAG